MNNFLGNINFIVGFVIGLLFFCFYSIINLILYITPRFVTLDIAFLLDDKGELYYIYENDFHRTREDIIAFGYMKYFHLFGVRLFIKLFKFE